MVFSSSIFLFAFLPITFILYLALPDLRLRNGLLILASLVFYAFGEPVYVFLMLFSALMNYGFGRFLSSASLPPGLTKDEEFPKKAVTASQRGIRHSSRDHGFLAAAVLFNVCLLGVFKYTGFLAETLNQLTGAGLPVPDIPLPIGISFYTFQALSYVITVYRDPRKASASFPRVLLYIAFFPQLIAGPIVRYEDIDQQLVSRTLSQDGIFQGIQRFTIGLAKKLLIANTLGAAADVVFAADPGQLGAGAAWAGALCYTLQIYFDFSGYSDMAIGMASMFGFRFLENFDHPYAACSIREFWRKWHMSLTGWFRLYVYIPLGGNQKGFTLRERNILIVFLLTGIWHGASWTFVIWGIYHGVLCVLEDFFSSHKIHLGRFGNLLTFLLVTIGFTMFRADTASYGFDMIRTMLTAFHPARGDAALAAAAFDPYTLFILIIAIIFSYPVSEGLASLWNKYMVKDSAADIILRMLLVVGLLLLSVMSLATASYNPFIYFRF